MGFESRKVIGRRMVDRRGFLKLAGVAVGIGAVGFLAACGETTTTGEAGNAPEGRLLARPSRSPSNVTSENGLRPLGLSSGRDGLLYIPKSYEATKKVPLALTLHGAGGDAKSGISHLIGLADEAGILLLSPESRGGTWDVLVGGFGPDVEFIDRALERTFERLAVDEKSLAVTGFSDGASYALSLGLTNGDLFTHVIAFSPGFSSPASLRGKPPVFVSHGTRDRILPIDRCSRRIVPQLERRGYEVRYQEFEGPHTVPESVARDALQWFTSDRT